MNEMLRSLGFGQVTSTNWIKGDTMIILVNHRNMAMTLIGNVNYSEGEHSSRVEYNIKSADPETMKRHVEKFMRMVGKCIQVDEE